MKKRIKIMVAIAGIAMAMSASAGVRDSKHNLGTSNLNTTQNRMTTGPGEVCVFCHTPHGSNTNVEAPLWNKSVPAANTFTSYSSSTIDGGIAQVGSVSIACLSCHDGSQAMDIMINQPGSGGYNAAGAQIAGGVWANGSGTMDASTGQMLTATPVPGLGKDLGNDHPVGIQYAGGGITDTTTAMGDGDFNVAQKATINSAPVWWIDVATATVGGTGITGNSAQRDKTDMILYTRTDGAAAEAEPMVECASCHDPHQSDTPTFLRIDNTGSAVCLACHVK